MRFFLKRPELNHKEEYLKYFNEWKGQKIVPMSSDITNMNYEDFVFQCRQREKRENLPIDKVPASTYLLIDEHGVIYGVANLRHELYDYLLQIGGHIGYGIRPSMRGHGYAKDLLRLTLFEAKLHSIFRVLVTCDDDNIASSKTIVACG